jgi:thioredoxin 1
MQSNKYYAVAAIVMLLIYLFLNPRVNFEEDKKKGIQFHKGTWEEAVELAKKEDKVIFLDIYATWCGPCKRLKAYTFSSPEVGEAFNGKFINVALDGEQSEGRMLMQKYGLRSFPSLLFINKNGEVMQQTAGYHNTSALIKLGKNILKN